MAVRPPFNGADSPALLEAVQAALAAGKPAQVLVQGSHRRARLALALAARGADLLYLSGAPELLEREARRGLGYPLRVLLIAGALDQAELAVRINAVTSSADRLIAVEPERLWQARLARAIHTRRPALAVLDTTALASARPFRQLVVDMALRRLHELVPETPIVILTAPDAADSALVETGTVMRVGPLLPPWCAVRVTTAVDEEARFALLARAVEEVDGHALLLAPTRGVASALAARLRERGLDAAALHGGLNIAERSALLGAVRDGRQRLLVTTELIHTHADLPCPPLLAFVRPPRSLESLIMLAERGDDAQRRVTVLVCHSAGDVALPPTAAEAGFPSIQVIRRAYRSLQRSAVRGHVLVEIEAGKGFLRGRAASGAIALGVLAQAGFLTRRSDFARAVTLTQLTAEHDVLEPLAGAVALRRGIPVPADPLQLAAHLGWQPQRLHAWLLDAEDRELLAVKAFGREALYTLRSPPASGAATLRSLVQQAQRAMSGASAEVQQWLGDGDCRIRAMARRLDWPPPARCGQCDRCAPRQASHTHTVPEADVLVLRALSSLPLGLPRSAAKRAARMALAAKGAPQQQAAEAVERLLQQGFLLERPGALGAAVVVSERGLRVVQAHAVFGAGLARYTEQQ